jgi:hypothetical protein
LKTNTDGNSRIIILIPYLGIVLKIARINPLKALNLIFISLGIISNILPEEYTVYQKIKRWFWLRGHHIKYDIFGPIECGSTPTLMYFLFRGIAANIGEFIYYLLNTKNEFLIPTYFSLFGIVNIQPLQKDVCNKQDRVFGHLCKFTEKNELFKYHAHTFAEQTNFCIDKEGRLRILDYGAIGTQKMVTKYGKQFHSKLERATA